MIYPLERHDKVKVPNECSRLMPLAYRPVKTGGFDDDEFGYWTERQNW
jgi:hypothetical protein